MPTAGGELTGCRSNGLEDSELTGAVHGARANVLLLADTAQRPG